MCIYICLEYFWYDRIAQIHQNSCFFHSYTISASKKILFQQKFWGSDISTLALRPLSGTEVQSLAVGLFVVFVAINPKPRMGRSYCWWFRNPVNSPVEVGLSTIIYKVLYIPGGYLGFLNHQQYLSKRFGMKNDPSCCRCEYLVFGT